MGGKTDNYKWMSHELLKTENLENVPELIGRGAGCLRRGASWRIIFDVEIICRCGAGCDVSTIYVNFSLGRGACLLWRGAASFQSSKLFNFFRFHPTLGCFFISKTNNNYE